MTTANHAASHHGAVPKKYEDWAKINRYHIQCLTYFLDKLKATPDGDGNLLDHTLILWASNMGDSNLHSHKDVGHMLIGGANGTAQGRPSYSGGGLDRESAADHAADVRRREAEHWRQHGTAVACIIRCAEFALLLIVTRRSALGELISPMPS